MKESESGEGYVNQPEFTVPPGATEVRQSKWAWLWSGIPWVAVTILFGVQDPQLALLPLGLGIAVTIPRYFAWRKTAYYITADTVIFQRGTLGKPQLYTLPAEGFQRIVERPGLFGKHLGYHAIDIRMRETGRVSLSYVPAEARMASRLISLRDRHSVYDEDQEERELEFIASKQRGETAGNLQDEDADPSVASASTLDQTELDNPATIKSADDSKGAIVKPDQQPTPNQVTDYRPDVTEYNPRLGNSNRRDEKNP